MTVDKDKLIDYVHDIINKSISAQGYLKVLGKTELNEEQKELIKNSNESLKEAINIIKNLRKDIRE